MPSVLGIGAFTLTPNATQTVVPAPCTPASKVLYSPTTPDAGNDGTTTSAVPGTGLFTLTHASNPRTDRTFGYVVVG
jgi:hypothetical protein